MSVSVSVTVQPFAEEMARLLVPVGVPTPHQMPVSFEVEGGKVSLVGETATGQLAASIEADGDQPLTLRYGFADGGPGYPETMFVPRQTRFTRAADALVEDMRGLVGERAGGAQAVTQIVNAVADKFTYGHPEVRFNDGLDEVPFLSCGLTEGSCVDINTYPIACLRAAGFEAGYLYGYFFPEEKGGTCVDGHCWVVTRYQGVTQEWDIAHHLKLGTRDIQPGLNPKPGHRVATAHSMGLSLPMLDLFEIKLLGEPMWVRADGKLAKADLDIRCTKTA